MNIKYLITFIFLGGLSFGPTPAATIIVSEGDDLQKAIENAGDDDTLAIEPGIYKAIPVNFTDSLCGNCLEHRTPVAAGRGFLIKGKSLHLIGRNREKTVLHTGAGYGLFFVDSPGSSVRNLTITGGRRDADGNATDAAVVVRNSRINLTELDIINNDNRIDSIVVGIGGVFGREGADIILNNCSIINNSWDGVALYRGSSAIVRDCLIKDGRGAGIGVTWDAVCTAYRNIVTGYWKGIGAFGTAWVTARNNAVYDNLGWGMIATGNSFMDIANNVVYYNGNCGVAVWSNECTGRIVNNIIIENGWKKEWVCPCVGVWNYGDWSKWDFSYNIVWNNKEGDYRDIRDQTGVNGNLDVNPEFIGESIFLLTKGSPAIDAGHPEIYDNDGSRSDIGLNGGPQGKARR